MAYGIIPGDFHGDENEMEEYSQWIDGDVDEAYDFWRDCNMNEEI